MIVAKLVGSALLVLGAAIAYGFRPTALVVIAIMTRDWLPLLDAVLLSAFAAVLLTTGGLLWAWASDVF